MPRNSRDVKRPRQHLYSPYKHGEAGLKPKMMGFIEQSSAEFLTDIGIPYSKSDVENAKKTRITPRFFPATDEVNFFLFFKVQT